MVSPYKRIRLSGDELVDENESIKIRDYWSWAYSDIMDNRNRGIFGEFLVACALGVHDSMRSEWDAVDLRFQGIPIEVKTSAYLQTWNQKSPSHIVFNIGKKKSWDANTNSESDIPIRASSLYVFCLLHETRKDCVNPLDLNQWSFYVLPTTILNEHYANSKTIGLKPLQKLCGFVPYQELKTQIISTIQEYRLIS